MAATKTYHHGDLRAALLAAAHVKLASDGYEALSLRALARAIGVASSAPYAHFKSREELLWALVDDGAARIETLFQQVAEKGGSPTERLTSMAQAYLGFAADEPEIMRLIYVSPITEERRLPVDASRALALFNSVVGEVMGSSDPARTRDVAIGCWSALHGFAMLRLHNRLAPTLDATRTAELVIEAAVRLARSG